MLLNVDVVSMFGVICRTRADKSTSSGSNALGF